MKLPRTFYLLLPALLLPRPSLAQQATDSIACSSCAEWNAPHPAVRIYGNSYYVGTEGLGAVLVTSERGHVLIDGGLPQSAGPILANIRALGFRPEDVRLILNSHAHFDHAGGLAALQRATGARVVASRSSRAVLLHGTSGPDDPQFGVLLPFPAVERVGVVSDGETLRVGDLALTAHLTPGHTRGGTTWTWQSCEGGRCLDLVYTDSQTPVSADGFEYTNSRTYPNAIADFERSHARLERLSCDILITPHPAASGFWKRVAARDGGAADALVDPHACRRYAANAREQLARRVEREQEEQ